MIKNLLLLHTLRHYIILVERWQFSIRGKCYQAPLQWPSNDLSPKPVTRRCNWNQRGPERTQQHVHGP